MGESMGDAPVAMATAGSAHSVRIKNDMTISLQMTDDVRRKPRAITRSAEDLGRVSETGAARE